LRGETSQEIMTAYSQRSGKVKENKSRPRGGVRSGVKLANTQEQQGEKLGESGKGNGSPQNRP